MSMRHIQWQNQRANERNTNAIPYCRNISRVGVAKAEKCGHGRPKFWAKYRNEIFIISRLTNTTDWIGFFQIFNLPEATALVVLTFGDILVRRDTDERFQAKICKIETNTDRILPFESSYSLAHKIGCIRSSFNRIASHCCTHEARKEEQKQFHGIYRRNGYRYSKPQQTKPKEKSANRWHSFPYISVVFEAAARLCAPHSISIAHKLPNTLRTKLIEPKEALDKMKQLAVT